jgi:hypothetical protein
LAEVVASRRAAVPDRVAPVEGMVTEVDAAGLFTVIVIGALVLLIPLTSVATLWRV